MRHHSKDAFSEITAETTIDRATFTLGDPAHGVVRVKQVR
jgi:hypothetical protein